MWSLWSSRDLLTLQFEPSDDDSDSEGDDEDEAEEDDEEEAEDEEDENGAGPSRKRPRQGSAGGKKRRKEDDGRVSDALSTLYSTDNQPRRLPEAVREAHYDRVQRYYEAGTHYGMSVAQTVYLLATVLERADNDLLWLAILGLTYQYVSSRINRDRYEAYHGLFLDEVVRLNHEQIHRKMPNPDDRSIAKSEELRFTLFRHWNLYDAMLHSGYVAGRMGIWKEKGKKRLQGLLAKMG